MQKADNRKIGNGLTNRQVRDVLNSLTEAELDQGFIVRGHDCGYDFLSYFGPAEEELRIGTLQNNSVLVDLGRLIAVLQDNNVE